MESHFLTLCCPGLKTSHFPVVPHRQRTNQPLNTWSYGNIQVAYHRNQKRQTGQWRNSFWITSNTNIQSLKGWKNLQTLASIQYVLSFFNNHGGTILLTPLMKCIILILFYQYSNWMFSWKKCRHEVKGSVLVLTESKNGERGVMAIIHCTWIKFLKINYH